jgi:hypothetical protein
MPKLRGQAVRWLGWEPQPGMVEVTMTDAGGCQWSFIDKCSIFSADNLSGESPYPVDVVIGCEILGDQQDDARDDLVCVTTDRPWAIEATNGQTEFVVARDQLVE